MNNQERTKESLEKIIKMAQEEPEYELLGGIDTYKNNKSKLKFLHTTCGTQFEMSGMKFLAGHRCTNEACIGERISIAKRKRQEQFEKELLKIHGDEFTLVGPYENNRTKVKVLHKPCGNLVELSPASLLTGCGCSICSNTYKRTTDQFQTELNKYTDKLIVEGNYTGRFDTVRVRHTVCGNSFDTTPKSLIKSLESNSAYDGCPFCAKNKKRDTEAFEKELAAVYGDEYKVKGEYINAHTPILIEHTLCGNSDYYEPDALLTGRRVCPYCAGTIGENFVKTILNEYLDESCFYKPQKTFPDLKSKALLRFDCAIIRGNEVVFIIEYDGPFHYEAIFSEQDLLGTQARDALKDEYCKNNNIELLRLSCRNSRAKNKQLLLEKLDEYGIRKKCVNVVEN